MINARKLLATALLAISIATGALAGPPFSGSDTYMGTAGGTANAQTGSLANATLASILGVPIRFIPVASNTGAATFTLNGGSAKAIQKWSQSGLVALIGNELQANVITTITWDGTEFQLGGANGATAAFTKSCKTTAANIPSGGATVTASHVSSCASGVGFSGLPAGYQLFLIETNAGGNCDYAQNAVVQISPSYNQSANQAFQIWADATNVYTVWGSGNTLDILDSSTGISCTITPGDWQIIMESWQ